MNTDYDIEKVQARSASASPPSPENDAPTSTSSPVDTYVHGKESGKGGDGATCKGKRKSKRKSRKCRLVQIEDDVGPIPPTTYDGVSNDLDIKRKVAAASKANRVSSPSSGAALKNTRANSDNLTDCAVASDPDQSTATGSHHANSTASSPGPDIYVLEAIVVEDRTAEDNERRTTEDSERSVYEAEYVPPQPWWKKYDQAILCSIILFGALIVGGILGAQPPDNKDPGDPVMTVQPSSEFCPTLYSDFNRRQLTYHKDAFDLPYSITNTGGFGEWVTKHVPVLTLSADDRLIATILVGSEEEGVYHPKVASENPKEVHFITHIMAKDQDDKVIALESMNPSAAGPAMLSFDVPDGVTMLTPYVWCNVHGLWEGASVMVTPNQMMTTRDACDASNYPKGAWTSVHADFFRRQYYPPFNSKVPYNETLDTRHTPYITLHDDGATASVMVGKENISVHPMDIFHFITEIYVMDDMGNIIVMSSLDPTRADVAAIDFNIPKGTATLTAYSWCNIHGHWVGPTIEI